MLPNGLSPESVAAVGAIQDSVVAAQSNPDLVPASTALSAMWNWFGPKNGYGLIAQCDNAWRNSPQKYPSDFINRAHVFGLATLNRDTVTAATLGEFSQTSVKFLSHFFRELCGIGFDSLLTYQHPWTNGGADHKLSLKTNSELQNGGIATLHIISSLPTQDNFNDTSEVERVKCNVILKLGLSGALVHNIATREKQSSYFEQRFTRGIIQPTDQAVYKLLNKSSR